MADSRISEVDALRDAKRAPAVAKIEIAKIRSSSPNMPIMVFEGDDDKLVYNQWVRRVAPDLTYRILVARGKAGVLAGLDAIRRDRSGLNDGVWFFVDRDFDELRGRNPGQEIFATERYAVENYLVDQKVVYSLIELEFHCENNLQVCSAMSELFDNVYEQFLAVTRELNFHVFVLQRIKVDKISIPDRISKVVSVQLREVVEKGYEFNANKTFEAHLSVEEVGELRREFEALNPQARFRGKYAMQFLNTWLEHAACLCEANDAKEFNALKFRKSPRRSEFTLNNFASRSPLPNGFQEFMTGIVSWTFERSKQDARMAVGIAPQ